MVQLSGSDNTPIKSKNEARGSVWTEEHDCIPLKKRLEFLLANKRLSEFGVTKIQKVITTVSKPPIDFIVKKEDEHFDLQDWELMQDFNSSCFVGEGRVERLSLEQSLTGELAVCNSVGIEANKSICSNLMTYSEVNAGIVRVEKIDICGGSSHQHSMLSKDPFKVKVECAESNLMSYLGNSASGVSGADTRAIKIPDVLDDLDHIVLKERQRILQSRKSLGLAKPALEGNSSGLSSPVVDDMKLHSAAVGKGESYSGDKESFVAGDHCSNILKTSESGLSKGIIAGPFCTTSQYPALARHCGGSESAKSGNFMCLKENDRICSSKKAFSHHDSRGGHDLLSGNHKTRLNSALSTFTKVKVEPLDNNDFQSQDKNAESNFSYTIFPLKSELEIHDEPCGDGVDHMLLRERMKLLASRVLPDLDTCSNSEYAPSALDSSPIASESAKPLRINRPRKRRKTATDSVETALEEDAPGLLQVLVGKGVSLDEIKLYGEMESDEAIDDSSTEDSFSELEAVISKLFSQRPSLLKLAPVRCTKGEKANYCLACLISLVEQTRYLQFRKWPVEWGWCRDLQSFIFVFERHNRLVLERPEYGYATYFFELVDSLPIDWQIKRLVTAMKLTSCSRITLIENKALMVGEDLTEGEARVLVEYGWIPNSGLGTMLNYCDRVVHDRKNEKESSEWTSKIGKILMNGYNGGTIVSNDVPKKVMEYSCTQCTQIKLEL